MLLEDACSPCLPGIPAAPLSRLLIPLNCVRNPEDSAERGANLPLLSPSQDKVARDLRMLHCGLAGCGDSGDRNGMTERSLLQSTNTGEYLLFAKQAPEVVHACV